MNEAVEGATGLNGGASSSSNEQKSTAPKTETETTTATKSQQNALKMAKTYLSSLEYIMIDEFQDIDQLQYEGFSLEDATYGADNCGADWMVQAEKSAKNYLDMMAFSHSGLVEQLMYEGYTAEEAEHGATSQGI